MRIPRIITIIYALIIFLGGFIGFYKVHSKPSLIASAASFVILMLAAWRMKGSSKMAMYVAIAVIALLDAFFTYRFVHSMKFFPSGMMSFISLITLFAFSLTLKK